ncbi:sugar kinase [Oceanobacillus manasiensis]|uniref:sugar kinase n=1 Tax=Oceanobacillus manasiensis TaxID=586413 RepID=UPI0005A84E64|nr:sugar kinase [Oceanobacillus manasiensis]
MDVIAIGETMVSLTPDQRGLMRNATSYIPKVAGAETNTLIGLSRLGHQTGWVSRLGEDELGAKILKEVRGEGVDTSLVEFDNKNSTGTFFKEIVNGSDARVYYYRKNSAASQMTPSFLNEAYIAKASYLYLSGVTPAISPSCRETVFHAIELAKKNDVKVVFDPNVRRKLWSEKEAKETLTEIIRQSDIVLPGVSEGEFLFGSRQEKEIGQACIELGAKLAVVKLGEKGAFYKAEQEEGHVEAYPVSDVVDPIGAGDGFAAGLLSGLLDGIPIKGAVERACWTGAVATMMTGDYEGLPDRKQLNEQTSQGTKEDVSR